MTVYEVFLLILAGSCLAALVVCVCLTGGCAVLLIRAMQSRPEGGSKKEPTAKISRGQQAETDAERKRRIAEENLSNFGTSVPQREVI